jgi:hypothetical protein
MDAHEYDVIVIGGPGVLPPSFPVRPALDAPPSPLARACGQIPAHPIFWSRHHQSSWQ